MKLTRRAKVRVVLSAITTLLLLGPALLVSTTPAHAAGTPSGPQYTYRMLEAWLWGSRLQGEAITDIVCDRSPNNGGASYSTSFSVSNSFSVTAGASFDILKNLLHPKVDVSGGITTTTTSDYTVNIALKPGQCARVFEIRDKYRYLLQKSCHYACSSAYSPAGSWVDQGYGFYSKGVGRAFYLV